MRDQIKHCKGCYHYKYYIPSKEERKDPHSEWYKWKKGKPTYTYCDVLRKLYVKDIQPYPNDRACEFFRFKPGYVKNITNEIIIES